MEPDLTARLKAEAMRLGFDQVGIAPAVSPSSYPHYLEWLQAGHAAGMGYLERQAEARAHPDRLLEGVRSIVVASFVYGRPAPEPAGPTQGKVARYARAADYHEVFWRRLEALLDWLKVEQPGLRGRAVADTAPLLERDFARLAGLGWVGKNTMLINRRLGSFTLLGGLLLDLELKYDPPHESSHCGTCTRCLDACPTDAFTGPYQLDARRCISYWTIEHKGPIPDDVAGQLDGWVFGCDVCQDVCPWNRKAAAGKEPALDPGEAWAHPNLLDWLTEDPATFSRAIKGTALSRSKRSGLLRNAAAVLGASGEASAVPALSALLDDADPVIRSSVARALGQIASDEAVKALEAHGNDQDPLAHDAIQRALTNSRRDRADSDNPLSV
ncbi:tRNA epoxyqueuosine(34) reductase QueG [Singulisphaera acidiphila]|uniref:Uncharacterized Fe-S protein n=1 Tax=Singulisphaera acidiphila (strain ATCC BAA-1392 / DSM 18658 / VKM B-2454 / MOB10) TaxID=886293 RepID=L0DEN8_SINAD|nr:tRNA epoxyqueuosine(34) reductase QueG [Singulisphaera acidiphila]AGA27283.1 uncharacterized Fe-S protein [Singulisphaera acidiphila DSM 18658]